MFGIAIFIHISRSENSFNQKHIYKDRYTPQYNTCFSNTFFLITIFSQQNST